MGLEAKRGPSMGVKYRETRYDGLNFHPFINICNVGLCMLVQFFYLFARFMITINYFSEALSQICLVSFSVCKNLSAEKPCLQFNAEYRIFCCCMRYFSHKSCVLFHSFCFINRYHNYDQSAINHVSPMIYFPCTFSR